jgi:DNA topoisomerase-3
MIARELVEHCRYRGPIRRLWLSALDDASIRKALPPSSRAPKPSACTTRRWGAPGRLADRHEHEPPVHPARPPVRLPGRVAGRSGANTDLRLVVDRDRSIANLYRCLWAIDVQLLHDGTAFTAQWRAAPEVCDDQDRCLNQALAQQAAAAMTGAASAGDRCAPSVREAALPFDLGTLQEVCSKKSAWRPGNPRHRPGAL